MIFLRLLRAVQATVQVLRQVVEELQDLHQVVEEFLGVLPLLVVQDAQVNALLLRLVVQERQVEFLRSDSPGSIGVRLAMKLEDLAVVR